MVILIMLVLGLCLGSFVNALVWRINKKKDWVKERSQCVHCGHELGARDLIPVISWLMLRGKCRYCKKPISPQYPIVEAAMALTFIISYIFWPASLDESGQLVLLASWLLSSVVLMALLVYDLHWKKLPYKLAFAAAAIASAGNIIFLVGFADNKLNFLISWIVGVIIASGIFLVLYLVSNGTWIGDGDIVLGLATGSLLHSPSLSFLMIFVASLLGTFYALPSLVRGKRNLKTQLPFGPYLIVSTAICMLFGQQIIDWYTRLITGA